MHLTGEHFMFLKLYMTKDPKSSSNGVIAAVTFLSDPITATQARAMFNFGTLMLSRGGRKLAKLKNPTRPSPCGFYVFFLRVQVGNTQTRAGRLEFRVYKKNKNKYADTRTDPHLPALTNLKLKNPSLHFRPSPHSLTLIFPLPPTKQQASLRLSLSNPSPLIASHSQSLSSVASYRRSLSLISLKISHSLSRTHGGFLSFCHHCLSPSKALSHLTLDLSLLVTEVLMLLRFDFLLRVLFVQAFFFKDSCWLLIIYGMVNNF